MYSANHQGTLLGFYKQQVIGTRRCKMTLESFRNENYFAIRRIPVKCMFSLSYKEILKIALEYNEWDFEIDEHINT